LKNEDKNSSRFRLDSELLSIDEKNTFRKNNPARKNLLPSHVAHRLGEPILAQTSNFGELFEP
jgi:hypothetical protein